ncbi:MAG TPA: TadE/TadG family type IV pilus assembly protein [Novosphingobium sp.]|nr:TadE/TadG family type IV pilus assembly protein [Novosphingobium sp.]
MRRALALIADRRGAAAAELALILPFLLALLFGGFEAGNFIWTHHKLVTAVRDRARFASRMDVQAVCNGATPVMSAPLRDRIVLLTRTGQIDDANARPRVPDWEAGQVTVTVSCRAFAATGIYENLGEAGPVVTVEATGVPYRSLFGRLGIIEAADEARMTARSSAAVIGI